MTNTYSTRQLQLHETEFYFEVIISVVTGR